MYKFLLRAERLKKYLIAIILTDMIHDIWGNDNFYIIILIFIEKYHGVFPAGICQSNMFS